MTRLRRLAGFLVVLAAAACATPASPPLETQPRPAIQLERCRLPRSSESVLCGSLTVFEDRVSRTGRRIGLNILVLPAFAAKAAADPVFVIAGGPGVGAASAQTDETAKTLWMIRRERDIVFVDQRGTGKSHSLSCRFGDSAAMQSHFNELFPLDDVRACREKLQHAADLRLYTTPIAMDDLDDVRAALGYQRINLYAVSYGSQAALQYLRQYPARVRSLAIAGVEIPAAKKPLLFARAAQEAMTRLIEDCAADAACHEAFPGLPAEFETVLAAFQGGPVIFEVLNPSTKGSEKISMTRDVFVERLRLMLYDLESASRVPLVIHHAAQGDWVPFVAATRGGVTASVPAMYLTITCSETVSQITEEDLVRESRDTFVGEYRTRRHMQACQEWPRSDVPASFYDPVASDVPVLMLSGELDPATPPHFAATAARSLPNSRQILIPIAAHAYWYPCMQRLVAAFISRGSARDLDVACVQQLARPPFATASPRPPAAR
jgi:pimeloyl-ACP methyl ester carboxylesterase